MSRSEVEACIPSSRNWVATDYPMTATGTDTWTLTLTGVPVAGFQYKFTLPPMRPARPTTR